MAVYTFTSGIESESVGQYSNYLLSSLATRTIGSFTVRTARGLFEFISSEERRTYAYYPAIVDLYTEIDFGNILYTPQPVTATDTVQVDDLNAALSNTILSDSGTGTGTTGGFNIGRHIRFNSTNKPRTVEFSLPNNINSSLTFEIIRGNDTNGGEDPDVEAESLYLEYYDGSSWTSIDTVVAHNDTTFNTLKSVEITIPSVARTAGTQFRLIQPDHSGNDWDHYGFKSLTYTYTYTPTIPSNDYGSINDLNATMVDHGRIVYVTTQEAFGFVKVVSEASWKATNSYEGTGIAFTFGRQTSPAVYGYIVDGKVRSFQVYGSADPVFSPSPQIGGDTSLRGNSAIGISIGHPGSGVLFSLSNASERKIYDYPATVGGLTLNGRCEDKFTQTISGEGNLFTLQTAVERSVFSYEGSGVLFGFDNLEESVCYDYNSGSVAVFGKEDYGSIIGCTTSLDISGTVSGDAGACLIRVTLGQTATVDSSQPYRIDLPDNSPSNYLDYGFVYNPANLAIDYGLILVTSDLVPFGLFRFDPNVGAADKFTPNWNGSGTIKISGKTEVPLDVSIFGTGSFKKLGGAAETVAFSQETTDLFKVQGSGDIAFTPNWIGQGTLFSTSGIGFTESVTLNPPEDTVLFNFTGTLTERYIQSHVGEGVLFTLQTAVEKSVFDYVGSGRLFGFNNLEERRTYDYNCSSIVESRYLDYGLLVDRGVVAVTTLGTTLISTSETAPTGGIRVDLGSTLSIAPGASYTIPSQLTTPQTFYDYGVVNDLHDPLEDYGWILGTIASGMPACIYGQIDIFGSSDNAFTPNWVGSGTTRLSGVAYVPLDAKYRAFGSIKSLGGAAEVVAYAEETTDLFKVQGSADPAFVQQHNGEGTLFGISGVAEAVGFNPVDITTHIRITGTAGDPTLGYTHVGSGTLFNFLGLVERASFDYVGSGDIKLHARKPEIYQLSDLAAFTLDDYVVQSNYINLGDINHYDGHTNLRTIRLKYLNLEEGHEKHTEVYDEGLCNDNPEIDYGFLVDSSNIACVDEYGIISSDTNSTTGCTRVTDGEVLSIQPGFKYSVVPSLIPASNFEDYGTLTDTPDPHRDYGFVWDTTGFKCPGGSLGTLNGNALVAFSRPTVGTAELGGVIKLSGIVEDFFTPPYNATGYISRLGGASITLFSLLAPSEGGTLRKLGGSAETVLWDPDTEQLLFNVSGACVPVFRLSHFGSGTFRVSGEVGVAIPRKYSGSGIIPVSGIAAEAFVANPPDITTHAKLSGEKEERILNSYTGEGSLFAINGSSQLLTFAEQPEVNIRISGISENAFVPNHIGSGSLRKLSGAAESVSFNPDERQMLFSFTGEGQEAFVANPPEEGTEIILSGSTAPEILTFSEEFFGTISISGESANAFVPNHIGSGSFRKLSGAAESFTANPEERQMLFSFIGEGQEAFVANPPEEGTEIRLSGSTAPEILTFTEESSGTITLSGTAGVRYVPSYTGSGTFRKLSGAAESFTANPDERQMLFSFTGEGSETHTENYIGVEKTIRIRRGALSDFQTFDWQPSWVSSGTIKVTGSANINFVPAYAGSGLLKKFSGAAESISFNPDERQMLFSFVGERISEKLSVVEIGDGNLFGIGGLSESFAASPEVRADLRVSGEVFIRFVPNNVGFGNIFAISGAAESITVNPDERQLLFSFTGAAAESASVAETKQIEVDLSGDGTLARSFAYEGSGSLSISGEAINKLLVNNVGFGNIFNLGGSAEAVTFNPDEKQMLFSFTGERIAEKRTSREVSQGGTISITGTSGDPNLSFANEAEGNIPLSGIARIKVSQRHFGSGSLFAFSGGAESVAGVPPTEQALFKVAGDSENSRTAVYIGSGSLRKLSGAAESLTVNPDERQMLFSFSGAGTENTTAREVSQGGLFKASGEAGVLVRFAHTGEGTISISGDAHTTRARDFVGFGTIPTLSGAAESLTFNPTERDMLFSFTGERIAERTTFRELGTTGKFTFSGTSGDPLLTFAEQPFVNIDVTGDSKDVRSRTYQGGGTLFSLNNVEDSFTRAPYQGSGSLRMSGNGFVQVQLFQPARVYVWII